MIGAGRYRVETEHTGRVRLSRLHDSAAGSEKVECRSGQHGARLILDDTGDDLGRPGLGCLCCDGARS